MISDLTLHSNMKTLILIPLLFCVCAPLAQAMTSLTGISPTAESVARKEYGIVIGKARTTILGGNTKYMLRVLPKDGEAYSMYVSKAEYYSKKADFGNLFYRD